MKKLEDSNSQQKMRFAARACKVNLRSDTPQNYQHAVSSLEKIQWIEAMQEEFDSHQVNKTLVLTEPPKDWKVLLGCWVYKKKYCPTDVVKRCKTCWIVKKFHQVEDIDY